MARPAKISSDILTLHMRPYLARDLVREDEEEAIVDRLIKNDAEVAEDISKKIGIEIDRNQIVYWRRKYNVRACHQNHGGARCPDYASGYDVVQLLHRMDTYRLSVEWVPGLTGGVLTTSQRECCQKLNQIARKIKNGQKKIAALRAEAQQAGIENQIARKIKEITALRASARRVAIENNIALPLPTAVGGEDIDLSSSYCGGKKTKGGGRVNIAAGQFYAK